MAVTVLKTSASRLRSELKTFTDAVLGNVETAYNSYEATKAAVSSETWSVKPIAAYFDTVASKHVVIAEATFIEHTSDNLTPLP